MSHGGKQSIAIIGGGPAGSLLAILLARRGLKPIVVERGARFAYAAPRGGRSINLALAARGIAALRRARLEAEVATLLIPMRGRMVHDLSGAQRFLPYGQRETEEIYSISRAALNTLLYELAAQRYGVEYRFDEQCVGVDGDGTALIAALDAGSTPTSCSLRTAPAPRCAAPLPRAAPSRLRRICSTTATRS
jgi:kynurenine 3-monooxygenase